MMFKQQKISEYIFDCAIKPNEASELIPLFSSPDTLYLNNNNLRAKNVIVDQKLFF